MTQLSELAIKRTDYHCHLLPGLDDGARHLEDSLAMARLLVAAGFEVVHCTPHCMRGVYDTSIEQVLEGVSSLQSELTAEGIDLELRPGMEYFLDEYFPEALETAVPLGGTTLLLVEAPPHADPLMVQEHIFYAMRKGFTPLFAHPERVPFLTPEQMKIGLLRRVASALINYTSNSVTIFGNQTLDYLHQQGCLFQGNIGSFVGYYGRGVQKKAEYFKSIGLYDLYGSDGHRPEPLSWCLERGLDAVS